MFAQKRKKSEENRKILTAKRKKIQGPSLPVNNISINNIPQVPESPKNILHKTTKSTKKIPSQTQKKHNSFRIINLLRQSFKLKIPNLTGLNIEKLLRTHVLYHKNGNRQNNPTIVYRSV
jgi:hypothetical protein